MARFSVGYLVLRRRGVWPCKTRSKTQSSGTRRKRNRACAIATCVLNAEFTNGVEPNLQGRRDLREQSLRNLRGGHTDRRIDRRTDSNGHGVTNGNGFLQKTSPKSEDHPKTEQTSTSEPTRSCADDCEPHSNGNNHSMSIKTDNTETDASNSKGDSSKKRIDNNNRQSPKENQSRKQEVGQEQMEGQHDQPLDQEHESDQAGMTIGGIRISYTWFALGVTGLGIAGCAGTVVARGCRSQGKTKEVISKKGVVDDSGYYTGTLVNGKPHGFGRYESNLAFEKKKVYVGKWEEGIGVAVRESSDDGELGGVRRYEGGQLRALNEEEKKLLKVNTGTVQFFSYGKGFYSGPIKNGKPEGDDGEFILFTKKTQGVKYKGEWRDGIGIDLRRVEEEEGALGVKKDGTVVNARGDLVELPCTLNPLKGDCEPKEDYTGPVRGLEWPAKNKTTITDGDYYKYYGEVKDRKPDGDGTLAEFDKGLMGTRILRVYMGKWKEGRGVAVTQASLDSHGNLINEKRGTFNHMRRSWNKSNDSRDEFFVER